MTWDRGDLFFGFCTGVWFACGLEIVVKSIYRWWREASR